MPSGDETVETKKNNGCNECDTGVNGTGLQHQARWEHENWRWRSIMTILCECERFIDCGHSKPLCLRISLAQIYWLRPTVKGRCECFKWKSSIQAIRPAGGKQTQKNLGSCKSKLQRKLGIDHFKSSGSCCDSSPKQACVLLILIQIALQVII